MSFEWKRPKDKLPEMEYKDLRTNQLFSDKVLAVSKFDGMFVAIRYLDEGEMAYWEPVAGNGSAILGDQVILCWRNIEPEFLEIIDSLDDEDLGQ